MLGSICFFNNKGGVGKTTLACNIAGYLAQNMNLSVLVVDADPQCNATQLILPDDLTESLYLGGTGAKVETLLDLLSPLLAGDASLPTDFNPAGPETNRFGVAVLPGHPRIALLEDLLSSSWTQFLGGGLAGARVSNWNTQLLQQTLTGYDLIIYDVGPSLGALNRSVLIGTDFFLAPMGCDIFSLIGIENIASWFKDWRDSYDEAYARCGKQYSDMLGRYQVRDSTEYMSRFVGYTVQQYITKTIRSEKRATGAYERILKQIPLQIEKSLGPVTAPMKGPHSVHLGDVPHMYSLVPLAQTAHSPILGLKSQDGLSGGQYRQQRDYTQFIGALANSLLENLGAVGGGE